MSMALYVLIWTDPWYLTLCMLHGTSFAHFVVSNDGAQKQKDPTLQGVHSFTALVTEWLLSKW